MSVNLPKGNICQKTTSFSHPMMRFWGWSKNSGRSPSNMLIWTGKISLIDYNTYTYIYIYIMHIKKYTGYYITYHQSMFMLDSIHGYFTTYRAHWPCLATAQPRSQQLSTFTPEAPSRRSHIHFSECIIRCGCIIHVDNWIDILDLIRSDQIDVEIEVWFSLDLFWMAGAVTRPLCCVFFRPRKCKVKAVNRTWFSPAGPCWWRKDRDYREWLGWGWGGVLCAVENHVRAP